METVVLKAKDGSTGKCQVLENANGNVKVKHIKSGKEYQLSESAYKQSLVEAYTMPAVVVQVGQMVAVFEKNTNKKVDTGVVTKADRESVTICGESYDRDEYSWMVLA